LSRKKRQKHNYTSELELKSLLIRLKNRNKHLNYSQKYNTKINNYIKLYNKINNKKYNNEMNTKKNRIKSKLLNTIIQLSEKTEIDHDSNERFGTIILLMIKAILTKPNFSGYTYKTDFYSDAIYKILRYLHNFDHTLISKISGKKVNAFAYISQIIFNSIIYIINTKKKERDNIKKQIDNTIISNNINIHKNHNNKSTIDSDIFEKEIVKEYKLSLKDDLLQKIKDISLENKDLENIKTIIYYPSTKELTIQDYIEIKPFLKNISVIRYTC